MRVLLIASGLLLVAGCAASSAEPVGDSTANIDEGTTSDAGVDASNDASACFGAVGIDATMPQVGFGGGGPTVTTFITSVNAFTAAGGNLIVTLPPENPSNATITRTLPSSDVTVTFEASIDPNDFLTPSVTFTATSGTVSCGVLVNNDYPCTFTDLVLTPQAGSDPSVCASVAVPTFTLHVAIQQ